LRAERSNGATTILSVESDIIRELSELAISVNAELSVAGTQPNPMTQKFMR